MSKAHPTLKTPLRQMLMQGVDDGGYFEPAYWQVTNDDGAVCRIVHGFNGAEQIVPLANEAAELREHNATLLEALRRVEAWIEQDDCMQDTTGILTEIREVLNG